ncbi:DUF1684 domain-containing protein [Microbacterium sp. B2969]|uniref:DUF1684 domain-containing protein n=1 Tax=Microbacterium alkaliflavum TaxID=3248839 RepID=A0ABW7QAJ1_9MICO
MTSAQITDRAQFGREWEEWHRAHEARRADPHGFLAVTGLHWLTSESTSFDGIPGLWSTGPDGPVVDLDEGESLDVAGAPATVEYGFGPIAERDGVTVGFDGGVIEVAKRGGHDILRPRRADHPFLASYAGTPTYVPNPRWRVAARFEAFDVARPTSVGSAVDGLTHVYEAPGELVFTLAGEEFRLVAFPGRGPGDLLVLFTDATSGITTYAANRSLGVPAPDADGWTVLDFNRAVNLPCAYTDFATCPLPPAENRLPIGIEAGEKTPLSRVQADDLVGAPA